MIECGLIEAQYFLSAHNEAKRARQASEENVGVVVGIWRYLELRTWKPMFGRDQLAKVLPARPKRDGDCSRCDRISGAPALPRQEAGREGCSGM